MIAKVQQLLIQNFQSLNIPILPLIGNHESDPVNQFSPPSVNMTGLSTQWLYDFLATNYSGFMSNSSLATIKKGGYYTVLIRPSMNYRFFNFVIES
jgi:hypothetical protein